MDDSGWTVVSKKQKIKKNNKKITQPKFDNYYQDSQPTILKKKYQKLDKNTAMRRGLITSIKKKKNSNGQRFYKIDQENENFTHKKLSYNFRMQLMKARTSKNITQDKLAQIINVKKNIINNYENGSIIPDHTIIYKLERALNTKLPHK